MTEISTAVTRVPPFPGPGQLSSQSASQQEESSSSFPPFPTSGPPPPVQPSSTVSLPLPVRPGRTCHARRRVNFLAETTRKKKRENATKLACRNHVSSDRMIFRPDSEIRRLQKKIEPFFPSFWFVPQASANFVIRRENRIDRQKQPRLRKIGTEE